MRILFLVPYPFGEAPSQRFRFEQYLSLLSEHNIEFSCSAFWSLSAWAILYKPGHYIKKIGWLLLGFLNRWIDLLRCLNYDLIFIHRECTPVGPPFFEFVISQVLNKKIVYDFDDAIWLDNTSEENRFARWIKFHSKVKSICRWSYAVSCGNDWLADFARMYCDKVRVNPTTVDTESLHNPEKWSTSRSNKSIVLGWTGTHSTLFYLNSILPVLQNLERKYSLSIHIISNKDPKLDLESVEYIPWNKALEIQQLLNFDIGLMPLANDKWAKGKCGFKALQYMALCIPCVASTVGVNSSIINHGVDGFLCETEGEWQENLEALIKNAELRNLIGLAGRKKVIERYSVNSNSSNFLSLTKL